MADSVEDKVDAPVVDASAEDTKAEVSEEKIDAPAPTALTTEEEQASKQHDEEEELKSAKVSLADLCAKGAAQYAHKNYSEACDVYAQASELQAELNGEMSPDNAEILFLYGRSLFKVGQSKSDVLGGRAAGEEKKKKSAKSAPKKNGEASKPDAIQEETAEQVAAVAEQNGTAPDVEEMTAAKKPLFQFTGDENFEDSDEEEEEQEAEEEEEDDLAAAFEVLDLARVLFTRKLEEPEEGESKGKGVGDTAMSKHLKERLADTHDLLAEISLENERFPNAVNDFKASLSYKKDLYPQESEVIAEAHFKLSLALEFASITTQGDDEEGGAKEAQVDEAMREEAAKELEAAIESTKLKLQNQEVELATCHSPEDNDKTRTQIIETKEIVADMEQRLIDLRAPPLDVNAALSGPAGAPDSINPMGGILGKTLGESPAEVQARIDEAKKTATDLTGLVRKKKAKPAESESAPAEAETNGSANGKRKADELEDVAPEAEESKKAKVEAVAE